MSIICRVKQRNADCLSSSPEQIVMQSVVVDPMFFQCFRIVCDAGKTLTKHWVVTEVDEKLLFLS